MIIDFSSLGTGDGRQVDLCRECRYFLKISRHDQVGQPAWLTGAEIYEQYGSKDVKITIRAIKRCTGHASRNQEKVKPVFIEQALRSGIDIIDHVDEYRNNILRQRHPNIRF